MSALDTERLEICLGPAGAMASVFAKIAAEKGHNPRLFFRNPDSLEEFERTHRSPRLKGIDLPDRIKATSDLQEAVEGADIAVLAPPSNHFRSFYRDVMPYLDDDTIVLSLSKGLEEVTNFRMTQIILDEDPGRIDNIAVLAGPDIAPQLAQGVQTGAVIASYNYDTAERLQRVFATDYLRLYTDEDVVGAEIASALNKVFALVAGMADRLGASDNSKALIFTRSLAEMTRIGQAEGAQTLTFMGLSGIGDFSLPFLGNATRNYRAGVKLAEGQTVEEILSSDELAEGLLTLKPALALANKHNLYVPILATLNKVAGQEIDIHEAVNQLMEIPPRREYGDNDWRFNLGRLGMRVAHNLGGHFQRVKSSLPL